MVYRAIDQEGREVAVKVLSPSIGSMEGFRERFEAEIASLERLKHPHIVRMIGYGEQDGHLFYAMELVPGNSLQAELTAGRRFLWREVTQIGVEIASALKHAHDHGIIHRDIKPANLLVDAQRHIKLTDFGIAKLFGASQLTLGGGVIGTADFMSPEQAEGLNVTPRSDLYSLGGVLYTLLAGRPPFRGRSIPEVIHKVRFELPTPVGRLADEVPPELEALIDRLLAKDPQERIPTPLALMKRLQAIRDAPPAAEIPSAITDSTGMLVEDREASRPGSPIVSQSETVLIEADGSFTPPALSAAIATDGRESAPAKLRSHFTTVEESQRRKDEAASTVGRNIVAFVALAIASTLLLTTLWIVLRPPTADQAYRQFEAEMENVANENPNLGDQDLADFLRRFPEDPRRPQVEEWRESLELLKLERRFSTRALRDRRGLPKDPLEEWTARCLELESNDPDAALARYQAMLDLFGGAPRLSMGQKRCLELARAKVVSLTKDARVRHQSHRTLLTRQLSEADKLPREDALKVWTGLLRLYEGQTWAEDLLETARIKITDIPAPPPAETP